MIRSGTNNSETRSNKRIVNASVFLPLLLIFCFSIVVVTGCSRQKEDKTPPSTAIVIRINNKEITRGEFQDIFKRTFLEGGVDGEIKEEELRDLKRALLNQLVEEELLIEEARNLALEVKEDEIAREIEAIKKEYGGEAFESAILNKYGTMDKWKEELKVKLLIKKVIDATITSRLAVKEDEARKYYKEHIDDYKVKEQIRARMIVVKTEEEANQIRERLKKGEDFAKLAEEVSLSPEGKKGGDLGFFGRGEMPKEFEDVVFILPIGKLSDVVKTPYGYHIFRVEEKRGAMDLKFSQVRDNIVNKLKREKSDMEFQAWMKALKEKASIEVKEELL